MGAKHWLVVGNAFSLLVVVAGAGDRGLAELGRVS